MRAGMRAIVSIALVEGLAACGGTAASLTLLPTVTPTATVTPTLAPTPQPTVAAKGCTSAAGCKGDQLVGMSRLLDADTRVEVGSLAVTCVLMDAGTGLYHCPANAMTLTGRGQIVFDEKVYIGGPWYPDPWPIVSGSGEFSGATGSVTSPKDSTWSYGDFVNTITK